MIKQVTLAALLISSFSSLQANAQKKAPVKTTQQKTSVANKTAKPTKQETMDWIAGKMKENIVLRNGNEFVSYKDGIFIYKNIYGANKFCQYSYDLNKVTAMGDEYTDDLYISGRGLIYVECDYDRAGQGNSFNNLSIGGPNYNNYRAPFSFTPDAALMERLRKAFTTLVEYNATKKAPDEKF